MSAHYLFYSKFYVHIKDYNNIIIIISKSIVKWPLITIKGKNYLGNLKGFSLYFNLKASN